MADVTFGTPVFQDNRIVQLPAMFTDSVRYLSGSDFALASTPAPGDSTSDFSVIGTGRDIRGSGTDYTLELQIPSDRRGVLSLSGDGQIVLASSGDLDPISGMTTVNFDTIKPRLVDYHLPIYAPGELYDAKYEFNTDVTGFSLNAISDVIQFEEAAAMAGSFTPYRWVGAPIPVPSNVNEVFLVTADGAATEFRTSTADAAYTSTTVADALGATGKFLGDITGAEADSDSVVSETTAEAYFDDDPTRYDPANTYYYYDGSDLNTATYTGGTVTSTVVAAGATINNRTYRGDGTGEPNLNTVLPEMLPSDWEQLDPAPVTDDGQFDPSGNGLWHGNPLKYLLLRWNPVNANTVGIFTTIIKPNTLRGPVTFT